MFKSIFLSFFLLFFSLSSFSQESESTHSSRESVCGKLYASKAPFRLYVIEKTTEQKIYLTPGSETFAKGIQVLSQHAPNGMNVCVYGFHEDDGTFLSFQLMEITRSRTSGFSVGN